MPRIATIAAPANFDPENAGDFAVKLQKECQSNDIVYVNMSKVKFISSTGLGVLIHSWRSMGPDRKFILMNPSAFALQILKDCNLTQIFQIQGEAP